MQEKSLTIEHGRNRRGKEKMTDKPSIWLEEVCKIFSEKHRNKSRWRKNNANNPKLDVDRRSCDTCKKERVLKRNNRSN